MREFPDGVYGSPEVGLMHAKAYRDAVMSAIPTTTNHESAVRLRKNNKIGIAGVRYEPSRKTGRPEWTARMGIHTCTNV